MIAVTIVITVTSSTSLNNTDITGLKDVIAGQLNVTAGSVDISVTCTSQNNVSNCEITVTISGMIYRVFIQRSSLF